MPLPIGANAESLRKIARAALAGVVLAAPLALWWPTIEGWAALTVAILGTWFLWLCWRLTAGRTAIPAHPLQLALLAVGAMAGSHLVLSVFDPSSRSEYAVAGEFVASLVVQIGLMALLTMLAQDLLPRSSCRAAGVSAMGMVLLCGALLGLALARQPQGRIVLAMLGWTGVALFCQPMWRRAAGGNDQGPSPLGRSSLAPAMRAVAATVAAAVLAVLSPPSLALTTAALALALLLAAAGLRRHRAGRLLGAMAAAALAALQAWALGWRPRVAWPNSLADWLGRGDQALLTAGPWDSSLSLLIGSLGWATVLVFLAGLTGCLFWAMGGDEARDDEDLPAAPAVWAAVLSATTLLCPGGLYNPAANVAFAVIWAVLPTVLGRRPRNRSGWRILIAAVAVFLSLGLAPNRGLFVWSMYVYGRGDIALHLIVGGSVTFMLMWLLDRRRWGAFLAVVASVGAAVAGEAAQQLFSSHPAELVDAAAHAAGAAGAVLAYLLCKASRWSESPDA